MSTATAFASQHQESPLLRANFFAPNPVAAKRGLLTPPIRWVAAHHQAQFAEYSCETQIYLCPQYFCAPDRAFPTMYGFDGPDINEDHRAYLHRSWRLSQFAADLISNGAVKPHNIVGIYPRPGERLNDLLIKRLTEPKTGRTFGGNGAHYARWLVEGFKPDIERTINALPGQENAVLVGASVAGLHCLNLALEFPNVFGTVCALSPSHFLESDRATAKRLANSQFNGTRFFFGLGGQEKFSKLGRAKSAHTTMELCKSLAANGWKEGEHFMLYELPGGDHDNRTFGELMLARGLSFAFGY